MAPSLGGSVSLPSLGSPQRHGQSLADFSAFRHTYVGANIAARAKTTNHLKLIETAHAKGNLPVLRSALSRAADCELGGRSQVQDSAQELAEAKRWMIVCENAFRAFDPASMGKMCRAVHELEKLRLGPMIWMDPMYPKLKKVRAIRPYLGTLRRLGHEHDKGSREFALAWVAAVEADKLTPELTEETAAWFKSLPEALEELKGLLEEEEVRLLYSGVDGADEQVLESTVRDRLDGFGVDVGHLRFRTAACGGSSAAAGEEGEETAEGQVAVVATGPMEVLARIRRLNAGGGEPELDGRPAALEAPQQREERTARLLELSRLEEGEEAAASDEEQPDEIMVTPRRRSTVRRADSQPDPAPPRKATLAWSLLQREKMQEREYSMRRRQSEMAKRTPVADDLPSLKGLLTRKFGNLYIAWKSCLDADGNGRISFVEFCNAMHEVGFRGHFKNLWAELDQDGSGFITLDELDPEVHETLVAFDQLVQDNYSTYAAAWKSFDTDGNGMLTQIEFTERCGVLGFQGNAKKLFKYLLAQKGAKYIKLSDFAPEAYRKGSLEEDPYAHLSPKARVAQEKKDLRVQFIENADLPSLKRMLANKYGSLSSAWRHGLDLDGNRKITFAEFSKAVKDIGFTGSVKAIWSELNADGNSDISLEEWDPKAHKVLSHFEQHVHETHGGHLEAWRAIGLSTTARLDKARFGRLCQDIGFPGNAEEVYRHLPLKVGQKSLTLADLDARALDESHLDPDRLRTQKQKVDARKLEESSLDQGPTDLAGLRKVMRNRYGTIPACWKHCLDPNGDGKLTYIEVARAARELGFEGSVKDLWVELDKDGKGTVSLGDLDAKADGSLTRFRALVLEKYGSFLEAWSFFDSKKNQRVDEETFAQKCKELGYEGNPRQLFKYLLDDPSKDNVTLADLDPKAAHESYLNPDRFDPQLKKREAYERQQEWHKKRGKYIEDVPALMRVLKKKFGSLLRAWKLLLDTHGNDKISFMEFCRSMQQLGVGGNIKEIWMALDQNKSGAITLDELDPKAHRALSEFKDLLLGKYGSYLDAWSALDAGKKRRLTQEDFVLQCEKLEYSGDARQLFQYLIDNPDRDFITLDDIDAQAAYESRIDPAFSDKGERGLRKGAEDLASLRKVLVRRYGTIPAAWKHCLDPGQNGWINFVEFCKAMRHVGYVGALDSLWESLQKDSKGHVTLEAFDPEAYAALADFREVVAEKHGSFLNAWKVFDRNGNGILDESEFEAACIELSYTGDARKLFQWLLDEPCFDRLTLADLDPKAAHESMLDPDRHKDGSHKKMLLEQEAQRDLALRKCVKDLATWQTELRNQFGTLTSAWKHCLDVNGDGQISFPEFCQALREVGFRGNPKSLWAELDRDENGRITLEEFDPAAHKALSQFAALVRGRFKDFEEAWTRFFDPANNGRVDEASLAKSCAKLGYEGDPAKLYKYLLDKPLLNTHFLTLEDIEPHHLKLRGKDAERELRKELDALGL